jgi:formate/nitrite transporter FocA (FNT family)
MSIGMKILGGIIFAFGLVMAIAFPTGRYHQPDRMALGGVLFGLALMAVGIYLIRL